MREVVAQNTPHRTHQRCSRANSRAIYAEQGFDDKTALLDTPVRGSGDLYTLDGTAGYFYGALAPSTGYIDRFCIEPYYKGFYLALPLRTNPGVLNKNVQQEKMFGIFSGVPVVGPDHGRPHRGRRQFGRCSRATPAA